MTDAELKIRRLRYRLNRQGMLELDAWLSPLLTANFESIEVMKGIDFLLSCEPPELQAMMSGRVDVPKALEMWLCSR